MRRAWLWLPVLLTLLAGFVLWRLAPSSDDAPDVPEPAEQVSPPRTRDHARPEAPRADVEEVASEAPVQPNARATLRVVVVSRLDGRPLLDTSLEFGLSDEHRWAVPRTTVTDASGAALFDVEAGRRARLDVDAPDHVAHSRHVVLEEGEIRIELDRAVRVTGVVRDAESTRPLAGVSVAVWDNRALLDHSFDSRIGRTVVTGVDGELTVERVPADRELLLYATLEGYGSARVLQMPEAPVTRLELELGRGGVVEGTVTGPDGAPLADQEVWLTRESDPRPGDISGYGGDWDELIAFRTAKAKTGALGRYRIVGVPIRGEKIAWTWVPSAPRDGEIVQAEAVRFSEHGEVAVRDIAFGGPAVVTVIIEGRETIESQLVARIQGAGHGHDEEQTLFKEDSKIVFEGVPGGPYYVSVRSPDPLWVLGGRSIDVSRHLEIAPGEQAAIRLDVVGSTLTGHIRDAGGDAISGLPVSFANSDGQLTASGRDTTGVDGSFSISGLLPTAGELVVGDIHFAILFDEAEQARLSKYARKLVRGVTPGVPVEVVLELSATLTGRFEGVPEGEVRVRYSNVEIGSGSDLELAEDGSFRLGGLPVGISTNVTFTRMRYAPVALDRLVLEPGEERDLGTLTFMRGFAVEGRVVDADGNALRGVGVETPEPWLRFFADTLTTDADGRFRVTGLPDRPTRLRFVGPNDTADRDVMVADPKNAAPLVVRLTPGAIVRGTILDADGRPMPEAWVWLLDADPPGIDTDDDHRRSQTASGKGRFGFRVVPGTYRICRYVDGMVTVAEVTLDEGDDVDLDVHFE